MRTRRSHLAVIALSAVFTAAPLLAAGFNGGQGGGQQVLGELDEFELPHLLYMREEEKLARDVYIMMQEQWDAVLFGNVADSEQRHMDAVGDALDRYGLEDPASDRIGVFNDGILQSLYDTLVDQGAVGYQEALLAAALIEETDILDLRQALQDTIGNPDLEMLYSNLQRGSRNHLRAFVGEIERLGLVYAAQAMEQGEVDEILGQSMERGGNGGGQGGRGQGGRN
ncbi:DUF2202 domain-containing protein [Imhoffiella purpurea]|uniref:DUF2202 domain-containing protein n=1 Tax=Imhoffiella purpurea TaxID=1249627 RepID=W9V9Z5_9GAMM|nr:DUF2202 domain-containing protein [Imhoffiella purpurea]EXJ16413.1 hypothetical protein D779_0347 [Imhoffiella purpurea]